MSNLRCGCRRDYQFSIYFPIQPRVYLVTNATVLTSTINFSVRIPWTPMVWTRNLVQTFTMLPIVLNWLAAMNVCTSYTWKQSLI